MTMHQLKGYSSVLCSHRINVSAQRKCSFIIHGKTKALYKMSLSLEQSGGPSEAYKTAMGPCPLQIPKYLKPRHLQNDDFKSRSPLSLAPFDFIEERHISTAPNTTKQRCAAFASSISRCTTSARS